MPIELPHIVSRCINGVKTIISQLSLIEVRNDVFVVFLVSVPLYDGPDGSLNTQAAFEPCFDLAAAALISPTQKLRKHRVDVDLLIDAQALCRLALNFI